MSWQKLVLMNYTHTVPVSDGSGKAHSKRTEKTNNEQM